MSTNKLFFFISLVLYTSCSTTPTGRTQLKLMSSSQMASMGNQSFSELKSKGKVSKNPEDKRLVHCISLKLLKAMNLNPSEWKAVVFDDDSPNAFALPGNNIGVHTGMIKLAANQHQLAAVIGHEIGHVLASHGNERVSQNLVVQGGLLAANVAWGHSSNENAMILAGLGLGAQLGILLPFSRKHESEADELGLLYMARAGFDPREAPRLWERMRDASKGQTPPEFLSTHPSPSTRIRQLEELVPRHLEAYQAVSEKPRC